jgi:hypothetical protein
MRETYSTSPPAAQAADPIERARWLFFHAIVTDAQGKHATRDAAKRELLWIAADVGPDFPGRLVERAAAWVCERLELPAERYHEAESAIISDVKRLFRPAEFFLAVSEPWGEA